MSRAVSLEVFRPVHLPGCGAIVEEIAATGDSFFGSDGNSTIGIGEHNKVIRTRHPHAQYRSLDRLAFTHVSISGDNVKRFGSKINDAKERLTGDSDSEDGLIEIERGVLSVLETYDYPASMARRIPIMLDSVVEVEDARYPDKFLFVLQPSEKNNGRVVRMLNAISALAYEVAVGNSETLSNVANGGLANGVLVAKVDNDVDETTRHGFRMQVQKQLLPVQGAFLDRIKVSHKSNL